MMNEREYVSSLLVWTLCTDGGTGARVQMQEADVKKGCLFGGGREKAMWSSVSIPFLLNVSQVSLVVVTTKPSPLDMPCTAWESVCGQRKRDVTQKEKYSSPLWCVCGHVFLMAGASPWESAALMSVNKKDLPDESKAVTPLLLLKEVV